MKAILQDKTTNLLRRQLRTDAAGNVVEALTPEEKANTRIITSGLDPVVVTPPTDGGGGGGDASAMYTIVGFYNPTIHDQGGDAYPTPDPAPDWTNIPGLLALIGTSYPTGDAMLAALNALSPIGSNAGSLYDYVNTGVPGPPPSGFVYANERIPGCNWVAPGIIPAGASSLEFFGGGALPTFDWTQEFTSSDQQDSMTALSRTSEQVSALYFPTNNNGVYSTPQTYGEFNSNAVNGRRIVPLKYAHFSVPDGAPGSWVPTGYGGAPTGFTQADTAVYIGRYLCEPPAILFCPPNQ